MDDLDPEKLWQEKGVGYVAPYNEVVDRVARWLEAALAELWDRKTKIKHPWFFARKAGLRAWSHYEAGLRLKPFYREKYTFADYCEWNLIEKIQTNGGAELKDPYWIYFTSSKTQSEGLSFWQRIDEKATLKRVQHQAIHRLFCCYWDRLCVPLEFWTYPAMGAVLVEILKSKGAAYSSASEGNLRQLVARLNLTKSKYIIVREFAAGRIKQFDEKAAAAAGLPKDADL